MPARYVNQSPGWMRTTLFVHRSAPVSLCTTLEPNRRNGLRRARSAAWRKFGGEGIRRDCAERMWFRHSLDAGPGASRIS
jgi:hypothetical protein